MENGLRGFTGFGISLRGKGHVNGVKFDQAYRNVSPANRGHSTIPTNHNYEVMKLLLLLLLGCTCSAHFEPGDDYSFDEIQLNGGDDYEFVDHEDGSPWTNLVQIFDRGGRIEGGYDDRIPGARNPSLRFENPETHHPIRHGRRQFRSMDVNAHREQMSWPVKKEAVVEGDLVLGGLMMVHERQDRLTCGPVMPQGGVQALEAMLYTLDKLNTQDIVPGVRIGAHILDDCDNDTYGLEMSVDFIKGE